MKATLRILFAAAAASFFARHASAELVLHYTFDDADIFGSQVNDLAGVSNNATIVGNVGTGVEGVLGQAIRLPNDDGGSYLRLPSFNNPMPAGSSPRTIAFWFNQGAVDIENKMFGYGTNGFARSFDVSLEGGGVRLRYDGGNVTWGSGFEFIGADGGFHHVAIRVPNSASDYLDVDVLLDGQPLPITATTNNPGNVAINTGNGSPAELNIGRSPAFAPEGDFIGLIDDFRVYDTPLSDAQIAQLADLQRELVLQVDPRTGFAAIHNPTSETITLDYYEITSAAASIDDARWTGLHGHDHPDFPAGSGVGDGWESLGSANADRLAEGFALGASSLAPGERIALGPLYNQAAAMDFNFIYGHDGVFDTGDVAMLTGPVMGDYTGDGVVNAADYTRWRNQLGAADESSINMAGDGGAVSATDYHFWRVNYGAADESTTTGAASATPEPSALWLAIVAIVTTQSRGRRPRVTLFC